MDNAYELKTKICERTGREVATARLVGAGADGGKTQGKDSEFCLCSHLCPSPCTTPPPETF